MTRCLVPLPLTPVIVATPEGPVEGDLLGHVSFQPNVLIVATPGGRMVPFRQDVTDPGGGIVRHEW